MTIDQLRTKVRDYDVHPLLVRTRKLCEIDECQRQATWYIEWEPTFRDYCCTQHLLEAEERNER